MRLRPAAAQKHSISPGTSEQAPPANAARSLAGLDSAAAVDKRADYARLAPMILPFPSRR